MGKIKKSGGKRNYGWGRNIGYAGRCGIMSLISKSYSTRASHIARWRRFCQLLAILGIKDACDISVEIMHEVAEEMRLAITRGEMKTSYAVNILSTANVVLRLMRSDNCLKVSPRQLIGSRNYIRTDIPAGMEKSIVFAAAEMIREMGYPAEAQVILQARDLGLRKKEACLLDAKKALAEAKSTGMISIVRGTKGGCGKYVERQYPISEHTISILEASVVLQGEHSCVVPTELTLIQFIRRLDKIWAKVRDEFELGKIHDLRAAAACELYESESGYSAPVINGGLALVPQANHKSASSTVSCSLGHGENRSVVSYCGSVRGKS